MNKPPSVPNYRGYFKYEVLDGSYKYKFYCEDNNDDVFSGIQNTNYTKYHFSKNIKGKCMISSHAISYSHGQQQYRCTSKEFIKDGKKHPIDGIYSIEFYTKRTSVKSVIMECGIPHTLVYFYFDKYGLLNEEKYFNNENYINSNMFVLNNKYGPALVTYRNRKSNEPPRLINCKFYQKGSWKPFEYELALRKYVKQLEHSENQSLNPINVDRWWDVMDKHDYEMFHLTHNLWD